MLVLPRAAAAPEGGAFVCVQVATVRLINYSAVTFVGHNNQGIGHGAQSAV